MTPPDQSITRPAARPIDAIACRSRLEGALMSAYLLIGTALLGSLACGLILDVVGPGKRAMEAHLMEAAR